MNNHTFHDSAFDTTKFVNALKAESAVAVTPQTWMDPAHPEKRQALNAAFNNITDQTFTLALRDTLRYFIPTDGLQISEQQGDSSGTRTFVITDPV